MKPILICICCIIMSACAKTHKDTNQSEGPSQPLQSTIPDSLCRWMASGMHEFNDRALLYTSAYDCGVREGKQCWYFESLVSTKVEVECD